jgi:Leucine Rich repeat
MRTPSPRPQHISSERVSEILAQARDENWSHMALVGPPWYFTLPKTDGWQPDRIYLLDKPLTEVPASVDRLKDLRFLALTWNCLGAEGGQALAGLTNLTSLDLGNNNLGDEDIGALSEQTQVLLLAAEAWYQPTSNATGGDVRADETRCRTVGRGCVSNGCDLQAATHCRRRANHMAAAIGYTLQSVNASRDR